MLLTGCAMPVTSGTGERALSDVGYIKHEQDNIEVELRLFEGKINTLEESLSMIHQDIASQQETTKRIVAKSLAEADERMMNFQATIDGFTQDLRELKTHANDISSSFAQYKRRFGDFEKLVDRHGRNIENLEAALRALTALVREQGPGKGSAAAVASGAKYKVKSGDTLEKIARAHKTTVRQIKEHNHLKNDLIIVGQELNLPQ